MPARRFGSAGQVVGQRLRGKPPVRVEQRVVQRLDAQRGGHARVQLGGVERLDQVVVGAAVQRIDQLGAVAVVGEHDHRDRRQPVVGAQPVEHLHAAEAGQLVVEQDRVRPALGHAGERRLAVPGRRDVVAALAELAHEDLADRVRPFGDEDEGSAHLPLV